MRGDPGKHSEDLESETGKEGNGLRVAVSLSCSGQRVHNLTGRLWNHGKGLVEFVPPKDGKLGHLSTNPHALLVKACILGPWAVFPSRLCLQRIPEAGEP